MRNDSLAISEDIRPVQDSKIQDAVNRVDEDLDGLYKHITMLEKRLAIVLNHNSDETEYPKEDGTPTNDSLLLSKMEGFSSKIRRQTNVISDIIDRLDI